MKYKTGVMTSGLLHIGGQTRYLTGLSPEIKKAGRFADQITRALDIEHVCTSAGGETHTAKSKHYGSYRDGAWWIDAIDLRTFHFTREQSDELIQKLRELLGKDYDIVDERKTKNHIHVEYDPK